VRVAEHQIAIERVAVPGGPGAGREVHEATLAAGGRGGGNDGVDVDVAGEPVGGAFGGVEFAASDLQGVSLAAAVGGGQGLLGPAVVGDVDRGAGGDDLVDAVQQVVGELDVGGA
jgi:hypothetical protein